MNKRCIALALGCVVLVEGCWYKSKGEYQHGRKNCTYIERDVRVSVDCTDEKITGSCVKNIYVVENGYINNVLDLMKTPFDRPYKFSLIFTYEEQVKFVKIINNIKNNALVT